MSTVPNYILTSRSDTGRLARVRAALVGNMLPAAILLGDIVIIVAMSCLTGIGYHLAVYRELGEVLTFLNVGVMAATFFVVLNVLLKEYRLSSFLSLSPHFRLAWRHWNVSCLCLLMLAFLAKVTVVYSRGWFVLFYVSTLAVLFLLR